jgi:protein gp37
MAKSNIEWTEMSWNPTTGCSKISTGCKSCYAEIMTRRLQAMGVEKYKDGFHLRIHEEQLFLPYSWKKSNMVFVNSMSDLFHEDVPLEFIGKVFKVMNDNPQHVFQILTKRAERLTELHNEFDWTNNIWMGVTVEDSSVVARIDFLRQISARVKFVSCEPLLGPLPNLNFSNIDWLIVGGESGHSPRPIDPIWVMDLQAQCRNNEVAFFFKQWGGRNKKDSGRELNGQVFNEMPKLQTYANQ